MADIDWSGIEKWLADNPEKPPNSILISISKNFQSWHSENRTEVADLTDLKEEAENVSHLTGYQEAVSDSNNAMRQPNVNTPAKRSRGNRQDSYTLW